MPRPDRTDEYPRIHTAGAMRWEASDDSLRVEPGRLEGPLQLCARCSPGGLATYWTRDLEAHLVATPAK